MFIVEIGAVWSTVLTIRDSSWFGWLIVFWLWLTVLFGNLAEAVAEGRGKAQADTLRKSKADTIARRLQRLVTGDARHRGRRPGTGAAKGRHRRRRGRRNHPRRRRHRGRHCVGERIGHHRRIGAGDPGVRRRPLRGHRRHHGALGPHRRQDHPGARQELHRPDDRTGRGRQPAEDAERDRAEHSAGGADHHLRVRGGDAAAAGDLLQGQQPRCARTRPPSPATASPASSWWLCWCA